METSGIGGCFVEDRGDIVAAAFCADLYESQRRALIENGYEQAAADYADENTFAFAFVKDRRKRVFANDLSHAARGRDISGGERRKAGRVHIADVAVKGDRLTVAIDQKHNARGALDTKAGQNYLEPLKLMFL